MTAAVAFRTDLANTIVSDPDWLPYCFDQSGMLTLCHVPVGARAKLPFLRPEFFAPDTQYASVASAAARAALDGQATVPLHFIFHTAFCGSTLLSNALDALARCVAFKEPGILTQLAHRPRVRSEIADRANLDLTLRLFARRIGDATVNVVKPSCFASPLVRPIMLTRATSRVVLLRSDLRSFLLSVARRGLAGHNWGRQAFTAALQHYSLPAPYPVSDLLSFTDLQVAGLAWLMRTRHFDQALSELDRGRCLSIEAEEVFATPAETLGKVARFLEIDADSKEIAAVAQSDVLRRHSKEGHAYGPSDRQRDLATVHARLGPEIDAVVSWVEVIASTGGAQAVSSSASQ